MKEIVLSVVAMTWWLVPETMAQDPAPFKPPFFAFENGVHFGSTQERARVLKELGYDGIGSANPQNLPERLQVYDAAGLKIYSLYVGGSLQAGGPKYDKVISTAIEQLKGRDTVIELFVQGGSGASDTAAVAFVRDIADQAKASGLRVVLYPHTGFYIDTIGDAVRIAKASDRENVGVMFNLCHFLNVQPEADFRAALTQAKPYLWRVSVSGGKVGGKPWNELIQTLDQGDFDQVALLRELRNHGFKGAVGLQCYGVGGDSRENLKRSVQAWQKNLAELSK
ncbi:sugar phosphate isomerase/epimerase family protein [Stieleria varia]|uniref:Xylose isomerase-like TIM barrel n=1 Tax=Stieleria varia TaxID=2528005 RepID=A0A5C6AN79_9BACT|nr:TIM barrel protein [Stieleria varia]TWU00968.1 Xylose isomerase-like TIM barrel [Stieleria varia]